MFLGDMDTGELRTPPEFAACEPIAHCGAPARREQLARLHHSEARAVFGYIWRRTGDTHLAEDLTSEVFVRAFERLEDLTPTPRARGWLLRVASNLVNRWARRRAVLEWVSLGDREHPAPECDAADEHGADAAHLRAALLRLPARFQCVLALHYVEGLEPALVAEVLELPLGTVHSRLSRGRERLRRELQRRTPS